MKFPNHILLDMSNNTLIHNNQYWAQKHFLIFDKQTFLNKTFLDCRFAFFQTKNKSIFTHKTLKLKEKSINLTNFKTFNNKRFNLYKIKTNAIQKKNKNYSIFYNFNNRTSNLSNSIQSFFNINFLKKEKIYTKLKYSRVPQYDIVSGGVAALFAGFLGFLICEKFGFELLDSGDFYFFFMYIVFLFFFLKLFVKTLNTSNQIWSVVTFKWLFYFTNSILVLLFNSFKLIFKKLI